MRNHNFPGQGYHERDWHIPPDTANIMCNIMFVSESISS